mgnify:CR=1 FL=1
MYALFLCVLSDLCFQLLSQILQILTSIKAHLIVIVNIICIAVGSKTALDRSYLLTPFIKSLVVFFKQFGRIGEFLAVRKGRKIFSLSTLNKSIYFSARSWLPFTDNPIFLLNRSSVHNRLRFFRFPDSIVCQSAYYLHIRRTKFKTAQFISSDPSHIIMLKQNRLTIGQ